MGQRLGQHFLKNPHYAEVLVQAAGIGSTDIVLEIGPGEGMLTRELLKAAGKVIAVEKDEALVQKLNDIFPQEITAGKLIVISADVRDFDPGTWQLTAGGYILAANIPYYITGELLRKFLESAAPPRTLAFLMQKEVADRILSEKESILSISVKAYGKPRVAAKVSKGNFNPPPSVDSAILVVENISKKNFGEISEERFFQVVRAGFASKRKLLANNLSVKFDKEKVLASLQSCGLDANIRAEDVPTDSWFALARALAL
jgi:16S rRNA (adenine1518-N6/adenine1519-N6)-dimethyltransferase